MECTLWVWAELLPQMEFKYVGLLLVSEEREEWETDRWFGVLLAVMWTLYHSIVVLWFYGDLSLKAKLSLGSDGKKKITDASNRNVLLLKGLCAQLWK